MDWVHSVFSGSENDSFRHKVINNPRKVTEKGCISTSGKIIKNRKKWGDTISAFASRTALWHYSFWSEVQSQKANG